MRFEKKEAIIEEALNLFDTNDFTNRDLLDFAVSIICTLDEEHEDGGVCDKENCVLKHVNRLFELTDNKLILSRLAK